MPELTWTTEQRKSRNGKLVVFRDTVYTCLTCGVEFTSKKAFSGRTPKYCSRECYWESRIRWSVCAHCGTKYCTSKTHGARNKRFCSKECASEWQRGRKLSEKHRASLSRAKLGKSIPHLHTAEIRAKISASLLGRPQPWMRGENHPNYKDGGRSNHERQREMGRVEYRNWRRAVFERDGYICQSCGKKGGRLQAHHIRPWSDFPEFRYKIDNGLTLCRDCHIREHSGEAVS